MKLGLYDIAKEKCANPAHTYTRKNSSRRIDFILGTAAVLDSVSLFQHVPDAMGKALGDHRAMCIDLDLKNHEHQYNLACCTYIENIEI